MQIEMTPDNLPAPVSGLMNTEQENQKPDILEYRKSVFMLCLGFARNRNEAQDLAQETFLRAFENLHRAPPDHLRPWLLQIARNCCIDNERRKKVRRILMPWILPPEGNVRSAEELHGKKEEIELVRMAVASLPLKLRDVLVLREYNDLSYEEIAQILAIKPGTVMSRLSRGRRAVIKYYQERENGR